MSDPGALHAAHAAADDVESAADPVGPSTGFSAAPVGIVLAAGAGTRFGGPKALARDAAGVPWVERVVEALRDGGCASVIVVLGAQATTAATLVPQGAVVVQAEDWADGVSASVRAGLAAAAATRAPAALIATVDVPDLPPPAVRRVIDAGVDAGVDDGEAARSGLGTALVQARYGGRPGHPVLIGRDHWARLAATLAGDRGARPYLSAHDAIEVDCSDLWSGDDVDSR